MESILRPKNTILIRNNLPKNYGKIKAREALNRIHNVDNISKSKKIK